MAEFLPSFAQRFAQLSADNLALLDELYHPDVHFRDPLHHVFGLPALHRYFVYMYASITELRFDFEHYDQVREGEGYLRWRMHFRHPKLASGRLISVDGCSHLLWRDEKVYAHHDYFDAGALLYEHLPLFGKVIQWLKRRAA